MSASLKLTGRYYRNLPVTDPGYETEALELPVAETAFCSLHCWDVGCPGGAEFDENFCVGMGYPGATAEAWRIMCEMIRPAMDAARECGLAVCHVQDTRIARRYPEWCEEDEAAGESAIPTSEAPREAIPGHRKAMLERAHGVDYDERSGLAEMDIPEIVAPEPEEPIVHQTAQFDRVLRERGIVNLIYAGFATDMCILNAPGGMGPMFGQGYRVILVRDATIGVEPPDFLEERIATRWGIRFHETHWGDTITTEEFIAACRAVQEGTDE
jgi:nicotinamidase-related amidase